MATKKQGASKEAAPKEKVQKKESISVEAKIDRLVNREDSSIKAYASVNIAGAFAVHGIKVIDSQKGLFVSMPSNSYTDGDGYKQYRDICHPITADARNELIDKVKEAYEQAIDEQLSEDEAAEESETESEQPTQKM